MDVFKLDILVCGFTQGKQGDECAGFAPQMEGESHVSSLEHLQMVPQPPLLCCWQNPACSDQAETPSVAGLQPLALPR